MTIQRRKAIILYFAIIALMLLSALPAQAMPGIWKLEPVSSAGLGGDVARTVYVPKGTQWTGASLHFDVEPSADAFLAVWVDGDRVMRRQFDQDGSVDLDIGNLDSGFHQIKFEIDQQKVLVDRNAAPDNSCTNETAGRFILKNAQLRYFESARNSTLRDLPDPLFNPQMPAAHPWQAMVIAEPADTLSASVAARIASDWHATAGIRWTGATALGSTPADFVLELVHNPTLDVPARIELVPAHVTDSSNSDPSHPLDAEVRVPARLRISFRDQAGAFAAANALLNQQYLSQLDATSIDLKHAVAAPEWGAEKTYKTLADYGVSDFRLGAQPDASLFLPVPSAWEPTDPTSGTLTYRVQTGLLQGSSLRLWIEQALVGSAKLSEWDKKLLDGNLVFHTQTAFTGQRLLPIYVDSHMLVTDACLPGYNGALWIDADTSQVDIPHRYKVGVGALQTALIARPAIQIDGQPGSFTAALALASSMHDLVGNHPLPFRIYASGNATTKTPVRISVDAASYGEQAAGYADRLAPSMLENGTMLEQTESDFSVLASNTRNLLDFADNWDSSRFKIKDNVSKAFLSPDGNVSAPERGPVAAALAVSSSDHYKLLVYIGIVLLLLIMLGAWLLGRRR